MASAVPTDVGSPSTRVRVWRGFLVVLVCWWAFSYRLEKPDFTNDDFDHLSKARQVLFGELPDRDFYDDGRPLTIAASALTQWISPTLFGELVMRAGATAIGVGFVCLLTLEATDSTLLSLLGSLFTIAMRSRLYNYPKLLLFPLSMWLLWRYVDSPTSRRRAGLALMTVVAALFRYDFGVYIGLVCVTTLVALHRHVATRAVFTYIAAGIVLSAPYLGWLAINGRLLGVGAGGLTSMLTSAPGITRNPVRLDISRGVFYIAPPPAQFGIRWRPNIRSDQRAAVEHEYALQARDAKLDGQTVRYYVDDPSASRLLRIVQDPRVEDTSGIDRGSGRLLPPSRWDWWQGTIPLLRLRVAEVFPSRIGAQGWLYYLFIAAVPLSLLGVWFVPASGLPHLTIKIGSLALLCGLLHQFLIQGSLDSRLPDVAAPTAVLLMWLAGSIVRASAKLRGLVAWPVRIAATGALVVLALITGAAVSVYAERPLGDALMAGMIAPSELQPVVKRLGVRPMEYWTAERGDDWISLAGYRRLIPYFNRCLASGDRLMIVGYAPDAYYVSERLFAGGINKFDTSGFNPTSAEVIRRLRGQSVPEIVVDEAYRQDFEKNWPELWRYVSSGYREVAAVSPGGVGPYHVLIDSRRTAAATDEEWNLPCFASGSTR